MASFFSETLLRRTLQVDWTRSTLQFHSWRAKHMQLLIPEEFFKFRELQARETKNILEYVPFSSSLPCEGAPPSCSRVQASMAPSVAGRCVKRANDSRQKPCVCKSCWYPDRLPADSAKIRGRALRRVEAEEEKSWKLSWENPMCAEWLGPARGAGVRGIHTKHKQAGRHTAHSYRITSHPQFRPRLASPRLASPHLPPTTSAQITVGSLMRRPTVRWYCTLVAGCQCFAGLSSDDWIPVDHVTITAQ